MGIKGRAIKTKPNQVNSVPGHIKESDLAEIVINHYNDIFEVFPEVPSMNGITDIILKDINIYTAIEVKKSFSFDVLEQAIRNKRIAHYSYIAVPNFNKIGFRKQLCSDYGIGLITINTDFNYNQISLVQTATLNRHIVKPRLAQWMKRSVSGSKNDRVTAFTIMLEEIEHKLRRLGGTADFDKVYDETVSTYSTIQSAKQTLRNHVRNGVVKTFRFEGNKIILNK